MPLPEVHLVQYDEGSYIPMWGAFALCFSMLALILAAAAFGLVLGSS